MAVTEKAQSRRAPGEPVTIGKQSLTKLNKIIALESHLHFGRAKPRATPMIPAMSGIGVASLYLSEVDDESALLTL